MRTSSAQLLESNGRESSAQEQLVLSGELDVHLEMALALFPMEGSGSRSPQATGEEPGLQGEVRGEGSSPAEPQQGRTWALTAFLQGFGVCRTGQVQPQQVR